MKKITDIDIGYIKDKAQFMIMCLLHLQLTVNITMSPYMMP